MPAGPLILAIGLLIIVMEGHGMSRRKGVLARLRDLARASLTAEGRLGAAGLGFLIIGALMTLAELFRLIWPSP